eukprot:403332973
MKSQSQTPILNQHQKQLILREKLKNLQKSMSTQSLIIQQNQISQGRERSMAISGNQKLTYQSKIKQSYLDSGRMLTTQQECNEEDDDSNFHKTQQNELTDDDQAQIQYVEFGSDETLSLDQQLQFHRNDPVTHHMQQSALLQNYNNLRRTNMIMETDASEETKYYRDKSANSNLQSHRQSKNIKINNHISSRHIKKENKKINDRYQGSFIGQVANANNLKQNKLSTNVEIDFLEKLWLLSTGADQIMKDRANFGYYQNLVEESTLYPNPAFYQIELDLDRTFPDDPWISKPSNIKQIRNILVAYVKRNPLIGYCQGMNFIVARLLKCLKEEEAFWVFVQLLESILPLDYYTQMMGVQTDLKILNIMIKDSLPQVSFAIFDTLFLIGSHVLLNIGVSILYFLRNQILETNNFQSLFLLIDNHFEKVKDPHTLLQLACYESKDLKFIKPSEIYELRLKLAKETFFEKQLKEIQKMNQQMSNLLQVVKTQSQVDIYQKKQKFVNRFQLLNGLSKMRTCDKYKNMIDFLGIDLTNNQQNQNRFTSSSFIDTAFENNVIQNFKCQCEWPICLYDFTFKVCLTDFFCYRPAHKPEIIVDYFNFKNLPRNNDQFTKNTLTKTFAGQPTNQQRLTDEVFHFQTEGANHQTQTPCMEELMQYSMDDSNFHELDIRDSFNPTLYDKNGRAIVLDQSDLQESSQTKILINNQRIECNSQQHDLLIHRGEHYCQDELFLSNFRKLFQLENMDLIESQEVLSNQLIDDKESRRIMENFVKLIIQVNVRSKRSTAALRKKSRQDDVDPRGKNSGKKGSPLTMQQLIEGNLNDEEPHYQISPRGTKSIFARMRSSVRKNERRQRTANLSTFTYPHEYVLTSGSGSNEKRRGEKSQYIQTHPVKNSKQRPRSQNLQKSDQYRLSKNSGGNTQHKNLADIKLREQLEEQRFKFMQKYRSPHQLKLIRRLTKHGDFQGSIKSKESY